METRIVVIKLERKRVKRDCTIRNIRNKRVEEKCPAQRIQQRLFQLVPLEMLVAHTLGIHSDALDSQHAVFLAQPPAVELVVRDDPQEGDSKGCCQEAGDEKDDFPGLDGSAVFAAADSDAVGEAAAEELGKAVETEPDCCS